MPESLGRKAAQQLHAAAADLLATAADLPPQALHWQPAENVWTAMDVLCHVEEFIPYWTAQIASVIHDPAHLWGRTHDDPARLAAVTGTAARPLHQVLENIRRAADASAAALTAWTDAQLQLQATSRNPRWGTQPAHFIADHLLIEHIQKHAGQIRRNIKEHAMSEYLFTPPVPVSLPVAGLAERYPVHRIFCVGRNYEAHAKEMGTVADREAPFYFTKAAAHCVPSGSTVAYPPGTSSYHYEMELIAAIGVGGFRIPADQALDHVYGYACGLDMTRRDLQSAAKEKQRPWDLGKDVEQSAVAGTLARAALIGHPATGRIELRVNGQTKQSSDLADMIHHVPAIIAHLSQYYHLQPGDLIYTGTPEGVGPVKPGDHLEGSIENVGTIALTLSAAE